MKLTVLGSGTSVPHPARSNPCHWLETEGGTLLLDIGPSAVFRMAQENLPWPELDSIWVSHFHLDHVGGLAPFLFGIRSTPAMRERTKPLKIFGPAGLRNLTERFREAGNYKFLRQHFPLEMIEVEPLEAFEILPGIKAVATKTPHTPESLCIRLSDETKSLVFTSDTGFDETLPVAAGGADVLLMECSFVEQKPVKTHLELAEAMHIVRRAKPKRVLLTHLYPEWDMTEPDAMIAQYSPGCPVELASDGLTAEI